MSFVDDWRRATRVASWPPIRWRTPATWRARGSAPCSCATSTAGSRALRGRSRLAQSIVDATGVELWYRGGLTMPGAVESARTHGRLAGRSGPARAARCRVPPLRARLVRIARRGRARRARRAGAEPVRPGRRSLASGRRRRACVPRRRRARGLRHRACRHARGPNLTALRRLLDAVPCRVAYGGGVASIDDLRALRDLGRATLQAVLVATALAEQRLAADEAVAVLEQGA